MSQEQVTPEVKEEILEHMMNPRNYGEMENPDCAGIGFDEKTDEFVAVYCKIDGETLSDIKFGTNGCMDTVITGSLFTEMVKGDLIKNAIRAMEITSEKLVNAPEKQRACTEIVLLGFKASMQNLEDRKNGSKEELCKIKMENSCEGKEIKEGTINE